MSSTFQPYFTLAEVQARLPFSEKVIRAKMKRGEFSPPGADGLPDLSNILFDGCFLIPLSGLEYYRTTHALSSEGLITDLVLQRLREPVPERPVFDEPVLVARSPGEARRKVSVPVQTSAQPIKEAAVCG